MFKLLAGLVLSAASLTAQAAPVAYDFSFDSIASGSFAYDPSLDGGVVGFGDLAAFRLQFAGVTNSLYDLSFLQSGNDSAYRAFAFDTVSKTMLTQDLYGFPSELSDIKNGFGQGFFVRNDMRLIKDYAGGGEQFYTSLAITAQPSAVPEPATFALLGLGFVGALTMSRRRRGLA